MPGCPVMEDGLPELRRGLLDSGLRWRLVIIATRTPALETEWKAKFPKTELVWDPSASLAREAGFERTPAARVWDASGKLVYSGAFCSTASPDGTIRHYTLAAARAVAAGRPVDPPRRPVVGCLLPPIEPAKEMIPDHVREAIRAVCLPCHVPGGHGPFSLNTDADIARWLPMIRDVVTKGKMPPQTFLSPGDGVRFRWEDEARALSLRVWEAVETPAEYWTLRGPWPVASSAPLAKLGHTLQVGFHGQSRVEGVLRRWTSERVWVHSEKSFAGLQVWPDGRRDLRHVRAWTVRDGKRVGFLGEWTPGRSSTWPEGFAQRVRPGDRIFVEYWTRQGWNFSGGTFRLQFLPGRGREVSVIQMPVRGASYRSAMGPGEELLGFAVAPSGWSPAVNMATALPGERFLSALGASGQPNWPLMIWTGGPTMVGPRRILLQLSKTLVDGDGNKYGGAPVRYGPVPSSLWALVAR